MINRSVYHSRVVRLIVPWGPVFDSWFSFLFDWRLPNIPPHFWHSMATPPPVPAANTTTNPTVRYSYHGMPSSFLSTSSWLRTIGGTVDIRPIFSWKKLKPLSSSMSTGSSKLLSEFPLTPWWKNVFFEIQ